MMQNCWTIREIRARIFAGAASGPLQLVAGVTDVSSFYNII